MIRTGVSCAELAYASAGRCPRLCRSSTREEGYEECDHYQQEQEFREEDASSDGEEQNDQCEQQPHWTDSLVRVGDGKRGWLDYRHGSATAFFLPTSGRLEDVVLHDRAPTCNRALVNDGATPASDAAPARPERERDEAADDADDKEDVADRVDVESGRGDMNGKGQNRAHCNQNQADSDTHENLLKEFAKGTCMDTQVSLSEQQRLGTLLGYGTVAGSE